MNAGLRTLRSALVHGLLGLMALVSVAPFVWMLIGATNTSLDITSGKLSFGSALGDNLAKLAELYDLPLIFWNTSKIAVIGTGVTLAVCSLAGYGFEVFASRVRERIYGVVLLSMMVPFAALMIPLFTLMADLELLDSHAAVILPTLASAYLIFSFDKAARRFRRSCARPRCWTACGNGKSFCSSMCR